MNALVKSILGAVGALTAAIGAMAIVAIWGWSWGAGSPLLWGVPAAFVAAGIALAARRARFWRAIFNAGSAMVGTLMWVRLSSWNHRWWYGWGSLMANLAILACLAIVAVAGAWGYDTLKELKANSGQKQSNRPGTGARPMGAAS